MPHDQVFSLSSLSTTSSSISHQQPCAGSLATLTPMPVRVTTYGLPSASTPNIVVSSPVVPISSSFTLSPTSNTFRPLSTLGLPNHVVDQQAKSFIAVVSHLPEKVRDRPIKRPFSGNFDGYTPPAKRTLS